LTGNPRKWSSEQLINFQTLMLWSRDFGFGIPELPYIAGRDLVGTVVQESKFSLRFKQGDVVLAPSTEYRDLRRSAYQEFVVASAFNISRVPKNLERQHVAGLGVAFTAAALALGVSLGCDFSQIGQTGSGPNLPEILRSLRPEAIPEDQRKECLQETRHSPRKGSWILIWGGSSTSAQITAQLAKLIGLRVIKVVDVGKHGDRLSRGFADLLIDSHNDERAIQIIRRVTNGNLQYAVDTVGRNTAELAQRALQQNQDGIVSHLVGLSGLPKHPAPGVNHHSLPMKVFHEVQEVGENLMKWLEALLKEGLLIPPDVELAPGGLDGINDALDRMRKGDISGKRLVIKI
jgi:NADPH:quinone reductase-like Zn-dependent oxidoreductase